MRLSVCPWLIWLALATPVFAAETPPQSATQPLVIQADDVDPVIEAMKRLRAQEMAKDAAENAAAHAADQAYQKSKPRRLTAADDGKTITITTGESPVYQISLNEEPTTGFSWVPAKVEGKSVALKDIAHLAGFQFQSGGAFIVVPSSFVATIAIKELGKTVVTMDYNSPGQNAAQPAKTFTVTINVVPDTATQPAKP